MGSQVHFTGEITLGNIAIVITLITIAINLGVKFGTVSTLVQGHTDTLKGHAERLDRYERTLIDVGNNMQRMIGRIEATQDRIEHTTGTRSGEGGAR